jgi:hypothetical protein
MCAREMRRASLQIDKMVHAATGGVARPLVRRAADAMPQVASSRQATAMPQRQTWKVQQVIAALASAIRELAIRWKRVL